MILLEAVSKLFAVVLGVTTRRGRVVALIEVVVRLSTSAEQRRNTPKYAEMRRNARKWPRPSGLAREIRASVVVVLSPISWANATTNNFETASRLIICAQLRQ
jgi:hypothetical protein